MRHSGRVALVRRYRLARVAVEPAGHVVAVVLLAPEHPGERLAHDQLFLVGASVSSEVLVELVCLGLTLAHQRLERLAEQVARLAFDPVVASACRRRAWRAVRWSRNLTSADPPAGTVRTYQAAAFVPVQLGLTVSAPCTTWSLMPSLGYGVVGGWSPKRTTFVSFSQNSSSVSVPSGPSPTSSV